MYYYLLSSLPYLTESPDLLPGIEEFTALCREQMPPADFALLSSARLEHYEHLSEGQGILKKWALLEMALRNEIARERSRTTGFSYEPYAAEGASWYKDRILQAVQNASPLAAEEALLSIRFELLCGLESGRYFTLDNVIIYYLKLQLLHRMSNMNKARGEESFSTAYQSIQAPLINGDDLSVGE